MNELLVGYTLWAIGTGIAAYFNVFRPILKSIANVDNIDLSGIPEFDAPVRSACVIMLTSTIFAPLIFFPTVFGPDRDFIETYVNKILPDDMD
jgi:hypothetical protein